jgi:hypothetical protein
MRWLFGGHPLSCDWKKNLELLHETIMGLDNKDDTETISMDNLFPKSLAVTATHRTMQSIAKCCASSARFEAASALAAMGPFRRAIALRMMCM